MQGALADTFKRFVVLGEIVKLLIPGKLRKLIQDTHTNETFSIDLVKKYESTPSHTNLILIVIADASAPRLTGWTS